MMKICIPTTDDQGLDSRLHDHYGSAPFYALTDTVSGEVKLSPNAGHHHSHGRCESSDHIEADGMDAVVCLGMGKRALAGLQRAGVDVLITSSHNVRDTIAEARTGKLRKLSAADACGGGRGRHGHSGQCHGEHR